MPNINISYFFSQKLGLLFLITTGVSLAFLSSAQPVLPSVFAIDKLKPVFNLDNQVLIFEDSLGLFDIDQIGAKPFSKHFTPFKKTPPSHSNSVYWLKVRLKNKLPQDKEWVLDVGYSNYAELYTQRSTGRWHKQLSGKFVPLSQKRITEGKHTQFPILLSKNITHTFFIKISNTDARIPKVQVSLNSYHHWHQHLTKRNLIQGVFHGFLWILAVYYTFVYFVMKDKVYIYYTLYIICTSLYFLAINGFLTEGIFREAPKVNEFVWYFAAQFAMITYFQLFRRFLFIQEFTPWWNQILIKWTTIRLISIPLGVVILLISFNIDRINWIIIFSIIIDICLTMFVLWRLNQQQARFLSFFIIGTLFFLASIGFTIITFMQDSNAPITSYPMQSGVCLQLLCYAIGLGVRFRHNERQKQEHQKILITELQTHQEIFKQINRNLEKKVEERTAEVATKNTRLEAQNKLLVEQKDRLESLNSIKAKLFSIISHDLRSPINSIQGVLHLMNSDALSQEEIKMLSNNLNNQVQITQNLLDNLLYWSKLQMQGININYTKVNLFQLIENTLHLFKASNNKNLNIQNIVQEDTFVWADANMIALVIRNLVANAVKFTPNGGDIAVEVYPTDSDHTQVTVRDNGIGIPEENLPKIFDNASHLSTLGTSQEKGTGLGLMLCKEFVEKNHGKIWVESTLNKGSQFIFTLPKKATHSQN